MKKIAILGSTGSIGRQTLDVIRMYPEDFEVTALSCHTDIDLLEKQIREFHSPLAAVYDEAAASALKERTADLKLTVLSGMEGLITISSQSVADLLVTAIVGMIGLQPTVAAIKAGLDIGLANKETLVTAGHLIMPLAEKMGVSIYPVDSEHSAIFQALEGSHGARLRRILLTASGGPFYEWPAEKLKAVTAAQALAHPNWVMGAKITIDSATMVNKGLELMEACWLFGVTVDQVEVLIQRESLIHSAVEYEDGSILAQMGPSDMRIPIQYALTWPERKPSPATPLDFTQIAGLRFGQPRDEVFKGLPLAREAMRQGGSMPTAYNVANEWANRCFREGRLGFTEIYDVIESVMQDHQVIKEPSVEEILEVERTITEKLNRS